MLSKNAFLCAAKYSNSDEAYHSGVSIAKANLVIL